MRVKRKSDCIYHTEITLQGWSLGKSLGCKNCLDCISFVFMIKLPLYWGGGGGGGGGVALVDCISNLLVAET
jgi:hypothetical protein